MDDADAAFLRQGDRQARFGHGIHRRRDERQIEADVSRERGLQVGVARQDGRKCRDQQHVVEGQRFAQKAHGNSSGRKSELYGCEVQSTALRTVRYATRTGAAATLAATFHAVHHDHGSTVRRPACPPRGEPACLSCRGAMEVEGQGRSRPVQRPAATARHRRPGHPDAAERAPQRSRRRRLRRRPRRPSPPLRRRRRAPSTPSSRPSARRPRPMRRPRRRPSRSASPPPRRKTAPAPSPS